MKEWPSESISLKNDPVLLSSFDSALAANNSTENADAYSMGDNEVLDSSLASLVFAAAGAAAIIALPSEILRARRAEKVFAEFVAEQGL